MKNNLRIAIVIFFQFNSLFLFAQNGQQLFWQNCASCHTIGKGKLVGPDLKNVETKHPINWLYNWIESSQTLVKSGDKAAVNLYNDNNNIIMSDQDLTKDQIAAILGYINIESTKINVPTLVNVQNNSWHINKWLVLSIISVLTMSVLLIFRKKNN